ncbi:MAG: hypothetical protein AAB289_10100, partial [Chloroflexota bacterium]
GYTPSAWGGDCAANGAITLAPGDNKTCTITNDDQPGTLTVIKNVINDNGGAKNAADFTLTVTGTNVQPSATFPGAGIPGTTVTLNAGTFSTDEAAVQGYTKSFGTSCSGTITNGASKSCTITNDDIAPSLTLNKVVVNDNGGAAAESAWNLTATGALGVPTNLSGPGGPSSADVVSGTSFKADTYTLAESSTQTGYTASLWTCTNNVTVSNAQITLALGQSTVCSLTNNDVAPQLKLVKLVTNDPDNQTPTPNDWTLSATAPGSNFSNLGGSGSFQPVIANTGYVLDENTGLSLVYVATPWGCDGGALSGSTVTLGPGDRVTCTISNAPPTTPQLKLVKVVTNDDGGGAVPNDWTLSATAAPPNDSRNFSTAGGAGAFHGVFAGPTYVLAETPTTRPGYTTGPWICEGIPLTANSLTLGAGVQVTCTITANDIQPKLTV